MLDAVVTGAKVRMTPKEVDEACGALPIRMVTCANGMVVGGYGQIGLVEHVGSTDVQEFMDEIKAKRDQLAKLAAEPQPTNPRANLYEFTKI